MNNSKYEEAKIIIGSGSKDVFSFKKRKKMLDKIFGNNKITKEDKQDMSTLKNQIKDYSPTFN